MDAKKTILVVEDEPQLALGLKDALEFEGFRVLTCGSGREGVVLAKSERPHAVLLDLMLPDINGYQVCEEIRRNEPRAETQTLSIGEAVVNLSGHTLQRGSVVESLSFYEVELLRLLHERV